MHPLRTGNVQGKERKQTLLWEKESGYDKAEDPTAKEEITRGCSGFDELYSCGSVGSTAGTTFIRIE